MKTKRRRKGRNFGYYVAEGFKGLFRHGFMSFAAITIMAACLLITGSVSLVAVNIDYNLQKLMSENEFLAYVDDSLSLEEAQSIQAELEQVDNVSEVVFTSNEQAKSDYLASMDANEDLYDSLPNSVFRHRFAIKVDDLSILAATVSAVEDVPGIAETNAALEVANGFVTVRNVVAIVALGLVAIVLVISLFIVSNAIKLATLSRQEEIAIMKMCGATNGFIRMPFVYEGVLLGILSAGIGFALQWGLYSLLLQAIESLVGSQLLVLIPIQQLAPYIGAAFAGVGLLVGILGSTGTIRKYLRV